MVEEAKAQNKQWNATPIGKMRLVGSSNVPIEKKGIVRINKWQDYTWANYLYEDFSA